MKLWVGFPAPQKTGSQGGEAEDRGHPWLYNDSEASLCYLRACLNRRTKGRWGDIFHPFQSLNMERYRLTTDGSMPGTGIAKKLPITKNPARPKPGVFTLWIKEYMKNV